MEKSNGGNGFGYIGRQCILNNEGNIYGYELLYRSGFYSKANVKNNKEATSKILINLINNVEINNFIHGKKAFINIDDSLIHFPFEEIINNENIVLEILEHSKVDKKFIKRINSLKEKGFKIALDDFSLNEETKLLIDYADYIKIDVLAIQEDEIKKIIDIAKHKNIKLLAEKVESYELYNKYKEFGFDLYQGYFFARPQIMVHKELTSSQIILLKLLKEINNNSVDINKLEKMFKSDAHLSYNLLKLINSAFFNFKSEIKNIRHAISLLGIQKLRIWIILLLYSHDLNENTENDPLFELAMIRAKILELLAFKYKKDEEFSGEAYLLGLLSLCDVILGVKKEEFISKLNIAEGIKDVLLNRPKIFLSDMLTAVELLEIQEYESIPPILEKYNFKIDDIFKAEEDGIKYVEKLKESIFNVSIKN